MRIDVALVPAEARRWTNTVCILLDELRASSTIVRILERGAAAVVPAASLAEARRLARAEGWLLAGEHRVVRAPGFDYGNSPAEVAAADLAGRTVVLSTRNGTAVLRALPAEDPILVGCLLNATAVARAALAMARELPADVGIVCAGRRGAFALDDAIAAGAILDSLLAAAGLDDARLATVDGHADPRAPRPRGPGEPATLTDAARAALQLWRSTGNVEAAFRSSWSGWLLAGANLLEDIRASLPVDATDIVPVVERGATPRIVARA
jgi:2-phosphosulfolactate phosphatase